MSVLLLDSVSQTWLAVRISKALPQSFWNCGSKKGLWAPIFVKIPQLIHGLEFLEFFPEILKSPRIDTTKGKIEHSDWKYEF